MGYKRTEIGEIPEEWEIKEFQDICDKIQSGGTPKSTNGGYYNGDVPFVKIEDITSATKYLSKTATKISNRGLENSSAWIVPKNSLLLAIYGSLGKVAITRIELATNQAILGILPKEKLASIEFYYYYFLNAKLARYAKQSTQANLTAEIIRKFKVPLPPLPEQRAIASVLSTVDDAIAKADEAIEKTKKVKTGLADKFFREDIESVEFKPLSEVFEVKTGSTPSTKDPSFWKEATIRWLTPADLGKLDGKITIEDSEKKISNKALEKTNLTLMPKESIIMSTRAPVGYLAILKEESTFNQGCKGLIPKDWESINTYYYAYYLLSQRSALENRSGQSTFKELSKDMLESFEVPVLSWEEQVRVVDGLGLIYKKIALEKSRKQNLERIKRGLMDELLTGRKRVKIKDAL